jgi:hypothetical protein
MTSDSTSLPAAAPDAVLYTERLSPAWWIWLVAAGFSAAWILVFEPVNVWVGVIVAVVIFAVLALALTLSTPEIRVTHHRVRAGRASIEPWFLSDAEPLRESEATRARGPEFNALSYQCLRGWIQPLVRVTVTDPQDSTPVWLISSRNPERLAEAINTAASQSRPSA